MAFNDREISPENGQPVALYTIQWGNTFWRYTSADRDMPRVENGADVLYEAVAISDNGMVQGGSSSNDFTVDCPTNLPIVQLYRGTPPSETIWLTVRRMHFGDMDAPIYWTGTVTNVKRLRGLSDAQILGAPLTASFKRTGLRLCWTRECPHFLYDSGCRADPQAFELETVTTERTGNTITLADNGGHPDGWFKGGFIAWEADDNGTLERRMIEQHVGPVLTIFGLTDRLSIGQTVFVYPGCDRTPGTCRDKFDNLPNYGGFDFMPGVSPFGTQIF